MARVTRHIEDVLRVCQEAPVAEREAAQRGDKPMDPLLFDWVETSTDVQRRCCLANILVFVQEALAQPHVGCDWELRWSSTATEGLAQILGAVEQALRFDVGAVPDPAPTRDAPTGG